MTIFKKLPGVLSFQRCLFPTDALFYNLYDENATSPLFVIRHGIRGTQNVNKGASASKEGSTAGSTKRENVSNPQMTDSAKLDARARALLVRFDLRFIDLKEALFACAASKGDAEDTIRNFRESVTAFVKKAKESEGLFELACRYARNIANGRFLWRNRTVAQSIRVTVTDSEKEDRTTFTVSFDALDIPLNEFGNYSEDERKLAATIVEGLQGNRQAILKVSAEVDMGMKGPVEVFPSQNYLEDKSKGFARSLYCLGNASTDWDRNGSREMGQAALRDQKIGNALRTIDTWYPAYAERQRPIPVEPNGASLDAQEFFRNDRKSSGFRLMERIDELDPATEDGMFLLACLIRGGVYSGSDN